MIASLLFFREKLKLILTGKKELCYNPPVIRLRRIPRLLAVDECKTKSRGASPDSVPKGKALNCCEDTPYVLIHPAKGKAFPGLNPRNRKAISGGEVNQ